MIKTSWIREILEQSSSGIVTQGKIPDQEELFQDHFPEFPILPGVLALNLMKESAEEYLKAEVSEQKVFTLRRVESVKFARYLKPGESWKCSLKLRSRENETTTWSGRLTKSENELAVSAQFEIAAAS